MRTLEDVSQIPWNEKAVSSGKAEKVPQALTGLLSPDEAIRNRSYWQLDNEVVLQSDLFEAAYFVIPFLIDFLSKKVSYGRDRIYDLLYEISNGAAPSTIVLRAIEGDEVSLKAACTREVDKGLNVFLRDTNDPNPLISQKAKELIELLDDTNKENNGVAEAKTGGISKRPFPNPEGATCD